MLVEIFTTLLTDTQSEIPKIKKVAHYKDEFNNEQWNPVFPCAFFRYDGTKPVENSRASDGSALKSKILISVFVGDKDLETPVTLNTVEKIENLFNDNQLSVVINSVTYSFPVRLTPNGSDFVTYVKGLSVYRVQIEIEVPTGVMPESDIELPGAVVLLSPNNGANDVDAAHANLSYDDLPDVLDYEIMIGDLGFENVLFHVTYYDYLNITLPDGIIEPLNTYYWKVRARNIAGYGAWSSVRSFTTIEATAVVPLTPLQVGLTDIWVRGDDITLSGANVSSWNDKSGNARHLTNATTGNRPVTEIINSRTFVKFDGTLTDVRNLSFNDSAHVFKITGTQTRTFAFSIVTRNNTPGRYNGIMARGNNNVGDEYMFRLLSNGGAAPYFYYYTFLMNNQTTAGNLIMPENVGVLRHVIIEVTNTTGKLYIDGNLISVVTLSFTGIDLPATAATFLVIGGIRQPNASQGTFNGAIGEFSSGAKALTDSERASLYAYHKEYYGV